VWNDRSINGSDWERALMDKEEESFDLETEASVNGLPNELSEGEEDISTL